MLKSDFERSACFIAARNLTANVAAVGASWNDSARHMHVIYYLHGPATDHDEDERELKVGELVAEFSAIQTASSAFGSFEELEKAERSKLVFNRP